MKSAVCMMLVVVVAAAMAAPAAEVVKRQVQQPQQPFNGPNSPLSQLLQDSLLADSSAAALSRSIRQADMMQSPLSQLLFDILQIPQAALQAVSRLLTNPGNSIGQSFNYASRVQQPMQAL